MERIDAGAYARGKRDGAIEALNKVYANIPLNSVGVMRMAAIRAEYESLDKAEGK